MPKKDKAAHAAYVREWGKRKYAGLSEEERGSRLKKTRDYRAEWARNKRASNPEIETKSRDSYLSRRELKAGRSRPPSCELCGDPECPMNGVSRLGKRFSRSNVVFDHCHSCGEFRGWICSRCNTVLGLVKDNQELLMAMADYLKDKKCQG